MLSANEKRILHRMRLRTVIKKQLLGFSFFAFGRGLLGHGLLHLLAALLARLGTLGALLVEKLLSAQ
jgi:hypothetical protein